MWKDIGFVVKSKQRKAIILLLENPRTPTFLAKSLKSSLPNISLKLADLKNAKLIECVNPEARKGRIYQLTKRGEIVLKKLKQMEQ